MNMPVQKKERRTLVEAPEMMSSADIINDEVTNDAGENLGRLEQLMVHLPSGQVLYAVVSYGNLLMSRKSIAVPWQAFNFSYHDKRFILNIPKGRIKEAPAFEPDRWPEQSEIGWIEEMYAYYGYPPPKLGQVSIPQYQGIPASSLVNSTVLDSQGEVVGKLKDLLLDLKNSEIVYLAVSTSNILGIDSKYYALPSKSLAVKEDKLVLSVTRGKLENGPSFAKDKWPDPNDQKWFSDLSHYYASDGRP